jgi:UMF1 family MFS transporter
VTDDDASSKSFLFRLGLHRPELRAWAIYDWPTRRSWPPILQVFPIFFVRTAAADIAPEVARARFAFFTSAAVILVGLIGPLLGRWPIRRGTRRASRGLPDRGHRRDGVDGPHPAGDAFLAAALFIVGNIGVTSTLAFYNSLLPSIARPDEIDPRLHAGFALGYLGGGLLLALNLFMIAKPAVFGLADAGAATRVSFLSVAVWWALFSIPLFRKVPEPHQARLVQSLPSARASGPPSAPSSTP